MWSKLPQAMGIIKSLLTWVIPETKKQRLFGCSVKKIKILRSKMGPNETWRLPRRPQSKAVNTKKLLFQCSVMMPPKVLVDTSKKIIFGTKTALLPPKTPTLSILRPNITCQATKWVFNQVSMISKVTSGFLQSMFTKS